jgi:hypothetical protein
VYLSPPPPRCYRIILQTVVLAIFDFKNQAKIMACGTLTPVMFWRIRTAALAFF